MSKTTLICSGYELISAEEKKYGCEFTATTKDGTNSIKFSAAWDLSYKVRYLLAKKETTVSIIAVGETVISKDGEIKFINKALDVTPLRNETPSIA